MVGILKRNLFEASFQCQISCCNICNTGWTSGPAEFHAVINKEDFLLSEDQALDLIKSLVGLNQRLKYARLIDLVVKECKGLVGAVPTSIAKLKTKFSNDTTTPTESEIIAYYQSGVVSDVLATHIANAR